MPGNNSRATIHEDLLIYLENYVRMGGHVRILGRTSSKGLVSLKQLSQTSFTARSADSLSLQLGLAITDNTARLRTHACEAEYQPEYLHGTTPRAHLVLF